MDYENQKKFGEGITRLINKQDLTRQEAKDMFTQVLLNKQPDLQQGAFLAALTAKGETAEEIAGSWEAIYEIDTVKVTPESNAPLVDNCGTGMDTLKTFNISTAASIIAAAAGVTMAKHGARAITSICGTVDILEELGVDVEGGPEIVKNSIEKAGIGIFNGMSPLVHPQALGRILSQIAFGTTLNIAASLANPALPTYGVRGVYAKSMVEPVAQVMREIGYQKAIVVHGTDEKGHKGMDEASTLGETTVAELTENGEINTYTFYPEDLGIQRGTLDALTPIPDRQIEAVNLLKVISGKEEGARSDIVCLNAALVLSLAGISKDIAHGFKKAKEIISANMALTKLQEWVTAQNRNPDLGLCKLESLIKSA